MKTKMKFIVLSLASVAWLVLVAYAPLIYDVVIVPIELSALARGQTLDQVRRSDRGFLPATAICVGLLAGAVLVVWSWVAFAMDLAERKNRP